MINIADNQIVREQVKQASSDPAALKASSEQSELPPIAPTYPAKSMVLEGGRYYTSNTEK
ncbi:hypothetical protein [Massilia timonae]|uniref:hypothetical protein n=1 Tax=Massilia timonae TaxID=47229 RepID=UPI0028D47BC8|nr:hypothetical protein [Massilia timonae]